MERFRDNFAACFITSPLTLRISSEHRALACARAYYYLHPFTSRRHIDYWVLYHIFHDQVPDNWSTELQPIFTLVKDWYAGIYSEETPISTDAISNGEIDFVTRQFYYSRQTDSFDVNRMDCMREMERVVFTLQRVDSNTSASWLLCLAVCCGVTDHPHDLAVLDKRYPSLI